MQTKQIVHQFLRRLGYDLIKYEAATHPLARRKKLLESYGIEVVIDVGANVGIYGKQLRAIGFKGQIISFEPLSSAYEELLKNTNTDSHWNSMNYALGNYSGKTDINIAGNSHSSSLLDMLPSHLKSAPESKYCGKEQIRIETLDSIFESICSKKQSSLLKIDTQGFEKKVIDGAEKSLEFIDTIQLEMSLIHLYRDELLFDEMYRVLYQKGYSIVSIEPGFTNEATGQLLQVDGIFHRFQHNGSCDDDVF